MPLGPQISALERKLEQSGYDVARLHYAQAVSSYVAGELEGSNAQLRTTLESILVETARRHGGFNGTQGGPALRSLRDAGVLLDGEEDLLRGLFKLSHRRGSHPGVSTPLEAIFRLQVTTLTARLLLDHLEEGG